MDLNQEKRENKTMDRIRQNERRQRRQENIRLLPHSGKNYYAPKIEQGFTIVIKKTSCCCCCF